MTGNTELKQRAEELVELERVAPCGSKRVMLIDPETVLTLIEDLERNQRMLLAACMEMGAIGNALNADMNDDGDALLRMVVELKAERDRLREDRDGFLEAGAHLL